MEQIWTKKKNHHVFFFFEKCNLYCTYCIMAHTELFDKSIDYQYKRIESMKKHCINCSVIGICNGGCILNGLNAFNEKNEGACSYWKTMWSLYLKEYLMEEHNAL